MESSTHQKKCTGILLAGGKSARMGKDKGLLLLNKTPFIQHIINTLKPFVTDIIIITSNPAYEQFNYECYPDIYPDCGPIGGIVTGLSHSKSATNVVLSCDIPLISDRLLRGLVAMHTNQVAITIAKENEQLMPLIGIYEQSCREAFSKKISNQKLKLTDAILEQPYQCYMVPQKQRKSVQNINTKADYKKLIS